MPADLVQRFEIRSWTVAHLLWPIAKQSSPACASRLPDSRPLRRLCSELDVQSRHPLLEDEPAGMRSCRDGLVRHSQQRRWERTDVAGSSSSLWIPETRAKRCDRRGGGARYRGCCERDQTGSGKRRRSCAAVEELLLRLPRWPCRVRLLLLLRVLFLLRFASLECA